MRSATISGAKFASIKQCQNWANMHIGELHVISQFKLHVLRMILSGIIRSLILVEFQSVHCLSAAHNCVKKPMISVGFHSARTLTSNISGHTVRRSCIFIRRVHLGRRQQRDLLVFESNYHLSSTQRMLQTVWLLLNMKQKSCKQQIFDFSVQLDW